jgi:hypothetical protein
MHMVCNGFVAALNPARGEKQMVETESLYSMVMKVTRLAKFIAHCMDNNIHLLRLPPHTSHLLQPLDVGLFAPLKTALSAAMDPLVRAEVARIRKIEWVRGYVNARERAFTVDNVLGWWCGAGLFPFDHEKVLRYIKPIVNESPQNRIPTTPATPLSSSIFDTSLVNSSPPDAALLHSTNIALNDLISSQTPLKTPERCFIPCLAKTAERLLAEMYILQRENEDLRKVLSTRREQTTGRRIALKDQLVLTTEVLHNAVAAIEEEQEKRKQKRGSKKRKAVDIESDEDDSDSDADSMYDFIVVEPKRPRQQ